MKIRFGLVLIACFIAAGCGPTTAPAGNASEEKSTLPATVAESVTRLQEVRDAIKSAFDAGTPSECDGALHDGFDLATALPDLATSEGLDAETIAGIKTSSQALIDHFMKIHEGFHGQGGVETSVYDTVADGINSTIESLAAAAASSAATVTETNP